MVIREGDVVERDRPTLIDDTFSTVQILDSVEKLGE